MKELLEAIEAVIEYMYEDEKKNWEECGKPKNHIFTHLQVLNNFVKSVFKWADEK